MPDPQRSKTIIVISLITIALSLVVMAGGAFNVIALREIVPGFDPMAFNTTVCFVLFAGALLIRQNQFQRHRIIFFILSLLGTLIGFITLLEFIFGFNSGLDELFVKDTVKISAEHLHAGRMAVNAAICFTLLGCGLLLISTQKRMLTIVAQYLFHAVTIISAIAIIGFLYGVSLYHSLLYVSAMSPHTAFLFLILSIAASLLNPSLGITGLFTGPLVGNKMIRRLFSLMILVVFVFGSLRIETGSYQLSLNTWVSIVSVSFLLVSLLILWNTAIWLNKTDSSRVKAEEEVSRINAELEKIVEDRTLAFQKSEAKYRLLIEQASDAIYVVDYKGNFTEVNASICRMTGYTKEELLRMNVEQIIDPEQLKTDPVKHGPRNPDEYTMRERRLRRKDGVIFDAEVNVKMFQDDRILVIARDITGRKKMEAELTEAELKFRTLAEQAMVGIYIFQQGKFAYVNPRFAEIFGYEPHELIGTYPVDTIIHENYRATVRENVRKRMEEEVPSIHYEVEGLKKDGTTNWVEFFGNRVLIENEPTIIGTMLDITERKHAEELMLKEKTLSDTIIKSLPGAFYLFTDQGKFLRWNASFESVMGYHDEEITNLNPYDLIAPEDKGKMKEAIDKVFEEGFAVVEANALAKDGTTTPLLLTGTRIFYEGQQCLLGMGINIASRVQAEAELRASEQKYKMLFDNSPMPLWMIDKDTLNIIAVNDVAAELYGYSREELQNMNARELRPPADHERQLAGYRRAISDEATDIGIVKHLKKDGTPMFVNIVAHDIVFEGKSVRLSFTNDITERLNAEESLQKSEANLQTILRTTNIVFAMLSKDLEIIAFNPKASEFVKLHYNLSLEKGHNFKDYLSPERAPHILGYLQNVLNGKAINYEIDYRRHWYTVSFAPITGDTKEILGMLITLEEITERKIAEQDLQKAYTSIQNHINSIRKMAWKQSHLMRSPLANLKALADLLKMHPDDTQTLDHFQTELNRLDAIIHEMAKEASEHDE